MINLASCDKECYDCVLNYRKKHENDFKTSNKIEFEIPCNGIPKDYSNKEILSDLSDIDAEEVRCLLDPVAWAAKYLDWHCEDPDGEIWKRKNPQEYMEWRRNNPNGNILGKSRYHRPYQKSILRCTAKRKVLRIGRQAGKSEGLVIVIIYCLVVKPGVGENEGYDIVLITPYQAQVDLLFKRIYQLITSSPYLKNSIYRHVKAPQYTIELNNNSRIVGFTAGSKSGGGAAAARGQHANFLCFDESDLLNKEDLDAAFSIITNYPNAIVWMSSTPTGKRERFFDSCNSTTWKEFHYPSYINPLWNEEKQKFFKTELTTLGWIHEIEADWGELSGGIFQNIFIEAAETSFKYGDFSYNPEWIYAFGVDWNDADNGTSIAVIGKSPQGLYFLVDKRTITIKEWTQKTAISEIVRMNRIWHPRFIYIDKGYGTSQWEDLRLIGFHSLADPAKGINHPDSKLKDVKAIGFAENIEVRDPWTRQPILKQAKNFMVENMTRFIENKLFKFSASDSDFKKQLQGYKIAKIGESGKKVFKSGEAGDHDLDAAMLGMLSFVMENSILGESHFVDNILFVESSIAPIASSLKEHKEKEENPINIRTNPQEYNHSPVLNKYTSKSLGLWSWPGFLRDEPPPKQRQLSFKPKGDIIQRGFETYNRWRKIK